MTSNRKCLFCGIAAGTEPSQTLYADDRFVVFKDIHPVAPVHLLIVPRTHITSVAELTPDDAQLVGGMVVLARTIAEQQGIAGSGYRLVFNVHDNGGQFEDHLHLNIIGGTKLGPMVGRVK